MAIRARVATFTRARAVACAATALALLTGTPATPAAAAGTPPSLTAATVVAGTTSPETLVSGDWTSAGGIWTAPLKTASPPAGRTVVSSRWRSPRMSLRSGARFAMKVHVWHQSGEGAYTHDARARACWTGGCDRWINNASEGVPPLIAVATLPWRVEYEYAISIVLHPARGTVWFEWQYRHVQQGSTAGETTIRLGVGDAARALA